MNNQSKERQRDINFALALKSAQLLREYNISIKKEYILKTLLKTKWQNQIPYRINIVFNDIFTIDVNEIIKFLSADALIEGSKMDVRDFSDLLGG